jgi:putative flippase GtrA
MLDELGLFVDRIVSKLNKIFPPVLVQFGVYASIGVLGALLDLGSFSFLDSIKIPYLIAFFLGKSIGITNNFFLNVHFNFKTHDFLLKRFSKFYGVGLIGILIGLGAMYSLVDVLHFNKLICNVVITFVIAVIQFAVNRVVSFKK